MPWDKIGEILLGWGGVGLLAICAIGCVWAVWDLLKKFIEANQGVVSRLIEENKEDREKAIIAAAERELKHDADRDEWLADYKDLASKNTMNQEKIANSLDKIEKNQERLLDRLNK
jgi:hypothetical protein